MANEQNAEEFVFDAETMEDDVYESEGEAALENIQSSVENLTMQDQPVTPPNSSGRLQEVIMEVGNLRRSLENELPSGSGGVRTIPENVDLETLDLLKKWLEYFRQCMRCIGILIHIYEYWLKQ